MLAAFSHVVRDHVSSTNQIPMLQRKTKSQKEVERSVRSKGK
jgi:hypothetical protein